MRYQRAPVLALLCVVITIATPSLRASADFAQTGADSVVVSAEGSRATPRSSHQASTGKARKPKYTYVPKEEYQKRMQAWRAQVAAVTAANAQSATARDACITSTTEYACGRFTQQSLPAELNIRPAGNPQTPGAGLDPTTIAYLAVARLTLTPPKPGIGPPPQINRWKMAAVGYPLWLWADGNLDPAPVSETVYDLTVSLDARLVEVVYDLGDGHKITCHDPSHRWTRAVKAGTPSPWCGYTYKTPSLPKGAYSVTAHTVWVVDWQINATRGSIPMYQSAATSLPVGELQVLVR